MSTMQRHGTIRPQNTKGRVIYGWAGMSFEAPADAPASRPTAPSVPAGSRAIVSRTNGREHTRHSAAER